MVAAALPNTEKSVHETETTEALAVNVPDPFKTFYHALMQESTGQIEDSRIIWASGLVTQAYLPSEQAALFEPDNLEDYAASLETFRKMYMTTESNKRNFLAIPHRQAAAALVTIHRRNSFAALTGAALANVSLGELMPMMAYVFDDNEDMLAYGADSDAGMSNPVYRGFIEQRTAEITQTISDPDQANIEYDKLSRLDRALSSALFANYMGRKSNMDRAQMLVRLGVDPHFPEFNGETLKLLHLGTVYRQFSAPTEISDTMLHLANHNLLQ